MSAQNEHDCEALRSALIQRAEGPRVDAVLDAHLAGCAACRRTLARAEQSVAIVRQLTRAVAPGELDGAVVAALQAGARQARAIRAVETLTPYPAPEDLARRIGVPGAPAVLERLVGEDLADSAKALASRYARRLERLRAPEDLERRLGTATPRRNPRVLPFVLVAAGLVLVVGTLVLTQVLEAPRGLAPTPRGGPVIVVERVDSVRSLDPVAADLLSGFLGGWVDAQRISREKL